MQSRYFHDLNYSLANEDTRVEYDFLDFNKAAVFAVCGSGARVLPLLAKNPKKLTIVDLSQDQLFLCELRIAAVKALSNEQLWYFLGYSLQSSEVTVSRSQLLQKLELSPQCREYWLRLQPLWEKTGFLYLGRWEKHFRGLAHLLRHRLRMDLRPFFDCANLAEQQGKYLRDFQNGVGIFF